MKHYSFLTESASLTSDDDPNVLVVHKSDPDCKFKAGDRVKISDHIRCFQKGHTGTVIGISKHEEYGYPQVTIKLDEPPIVGSRKYGDVFTIGDASVEFL